MKYIQKIRCSGFTQMELVVVMILLVIPFLAVGILLAGGNRGWQQTYENVNSVHRQDSMAVSAAFSALGRRSNRANYKVYKVANGTFSRAVPPDGQTIAAGQAVEFRYWATPFNPASAKADVMDISNTGTHYVLFYLDGKELKADYGKVSGDTGGVSSGGLRISSATRTEVLARGVDTTSNDEIFSHTVLGGVGSGAVRMNLTIQGDDGETVEVRTATFLRIMWPQ